MYTNEVALHPCSALSFFSSDVCWGLSRISRGHRLHKGCSGLSRVCRDRFRLPPNGRHWDFGCSSVFLSTPSQGSPDTNNRRRLALIGRGQRRVLGGTCSPSSSLLTQPCPPGVGGCGEMLPPCGLMRGTLLLTRWVPVSQNPTQNLSSSAHSCCEGGRRIFGPHPNGSPLPVAESNTQPCRYGNWLEQVCSAAAVCLGECLTVIGPCPVPALGAKWRTSLVLTWKDLTGVR